jgi:integrase
MRVLTASLAARARELRAGLTEPWAPAQALPYLLVLRDQLLFRYLWASLQRGGEGARLRPCDLSSAVAAPYLTVRPNGLKQRQQRDCGSLDLVHEQCPDVCFLCALPAYLAEMARGGVDICGLGYMFPTSDPQHRGLLAQPLSSGAALQRLKLHAAASGLPDCYTLHSFRRGGNQYMHDEGVSPAAIQTRMMVSTPGMVELYNNRTRPTRGCRSLAAGPLDEGLGP